MMRRRVMTIMLLGAIILIYTYAFGAGETRKDPSSSKTATQQEVKTTAPAQQEVKTAAPSEVKQTQAGTTETKVEQEIYIYNPGTRRDPFLSIIVAEKAAKEATKGLKNVPPLEAYDISQFKLIAILFEKSQKYAVIGLPDGKFYNIKEGAIVGVNEGRVFRVMPDSIIVRERIRDYRGKTAVNDTTLKLRKEEEKQ